MTGKLLHSFYCTEHKLWPMKHRGLSSASSAFNSRSESLLTWKRRKNLSCWECMPHSTTMHFNAGVRADFHQLSKHLPNQIIACKICGFQIFAILKQHLVINLITATIRQPMYFVCKQCICSRKSGALLCCIADWLRQRWAFQAFETKETISQTESCWL